MAGLSAALLPALLAVAGAASPPGDSGSAVPEQLVQSPARYAQSTLEAPASVTVITREEIRRFGYRTLAEALSSVAGVFASYDRNYTYATVRGMSRLGDFNTRILVLVDGRRLNAPATDAVLLGTDAALDLDLVERIEVMRGPGSTLYGTNSFYSVVNLVTRNGAALDGVEVRGSAGSFETFGGSLVGGTRRGDGLDVAGGVAGLHSAGPDLYFPELDAPETNGGQARGLDGDRYGRAFLRLQKGDLNLEALFSDRRKEIPTASFETVFGDPRALTRDRSAMLSVQYEHAFANLSRLWATASYNHASYEGDYPYEDGLFSDYDRSHWLTLEGQYQAFVGAHRLTVGAEARHNELELGGGEDYLDDRSNRVLAAFAQGEFQVHERLTLHAGLRYDHYQTFGGTLNPRLAAVVRWSDDTSLKALYGQAFRAPSTYELTYNDGGLTQKPAEALDPETLRTFELVLEHRLRPRLHLSASAYHTRVRDLIGITTDPDDGLLVYRNLADARTSGVEAELAGLVGSNLLVRAGWAYQRAREAEDGRPVGSPRHLGALSASLALADSQVLPGLAVRHVGERPTFSGQGAGSHTLADLTLLCRPRAVKGLELAVRVRNLFDSAYGDPGGEEHVQDLITQDGRTFRLDVRLTF